MIEAATLSIRDVHSGDEALVIVRYDSQHVAVALSRRDDGDIEIVMKREDAQRVIDALRRATRSE